MVFTNKWFCQEPELSVEIGEVPELPWNMDPPGAGKVKDTFPAPEFWMSLRLHNDKLDSYPLSPARKSDTSFRFLR